MRSTTVSERTPEEIARGISPCEAPCRRNAWLSGHRVCLGCLRADQITFAIKRERAERDSLRAQLAEAEKDHAKVENQP